MFSRDRLGPLAGVAFVVLELAGVAAGVAGGRSTVVLGDPSSKIVEGFSDPVSTAFWAGAYLELLAMVAFGVFAAWLFRSSPAGRMAAGIYIAVTIVALVVGDVLGHRAGQGLAASETVTMFELQSGLFFATWGIAAVVLALAPVTGWLRTSALAIAALQLLALAFPTAGPSQFPNMLFLFWCVAAGVALARRPEPRLAVPGAELGRA